MTLLGSFRYILQSTPVTTISIGHYRCWRGRTDGIIYRDIHYRVVIVSSPESLLPVKAPRPLSISPKTQTVYKNIITLME